MSVAEIMEVNAESEKSCSDAIDQGIKQASKTVHGIKAAWVNGPQVVVDGDWIVAYRVDLKITSVLD